LDGSDHFATLRFMSLQDSTFLLSQLTKSQKADPTVQLSPLINGCDLFTIFVSGVSDVIDSRPPDSRNHDYVDRAPHVPLK
jgi:hypothetical protein